MSLFAADNTEARTPVTVLTGFLGSGKTTVLNHALRQPQFADTAVIINEFGAIGLDHWLVESVDGEMVVLKSGCICCSIRSDLESSLRELLARRDEQRLSFGRIVIETTGLADPAPIVQLSLGNPLTAHFLAPARVVTTVDAPYGAERLARFAEARKQVALADHVLLTQLDLAPAMEADTRRTVSGLNPFTPITACERGVVDPAVLLEPGRARWRVADDRAGHSGYADHLRHTHGGGQETDGVGHGRIESLVLSAAEPLDWLRLQTWLAALRAERGTQLLRVKGVLNLQGEAQPVAIHGVHHVFHPAVRLRRWPTADRTSRLVLIVQDLDPEVLRRSFAAHVQAASQAA